MDLLTCVRRTIRRHDLARDGTRVVIALSGGSDSVALAHLLHALDASAELHVAGVAHFNHQLRSAASDDERFCEGVAAAIGRPLLVDRADVAARARRERRSIEDAGRAARYEFLERARLHFEADVVALGHTRDDQAETLLLRLIRGAGSRGLAAMHPRRGRIIRPLLDCRRAALRAYLEALHIAFIADESNDDVSIPRNRVRAELLPLLEGRFNPSIVDALASEAEIAREEWTWLHEEAARLGACICQRNGDVWRIEADALNAAPPALARMIVHDAMVNASRGRTIAFHHVEDALEVGRGTGGSFDAPGQRLERIGAFLVLTGRAAGTLGHGNSASPVNFFRYPLSIPGEVELAAFRLAVSAEALPPGDPAGAILGGVRSPRPVDLPAEPSLERTVALVRSDRCQGQLAVRNRRPGDRFHPPGLGGWKKLQDYFVDRKVPRLERGGVPLVVDASDRIVWVAGHAIDEEFRVTDAAQAVLILRLKVLGGSA